jgi:hypothetical protein
MRMTLIELKRKRFGAQEAIVPGNSQACLQVGSSRGPALSRVGVGTRSIPHVLPN